MFTLQHWTMEHHNINAANEAKDGEDAPFTASSISIHGSIIKMYVVLLTYNVDVVIVVGADTTVNADMAEELGEAIAEFYMGMTCSDIQLKWSNKVIFIKAANNY